MRSSVQFEVRSRRRKESLAFKDFFFVMRKVKLYAQGLFKGSDSIDMLINEVGSPGGFLAVHELVIPLLQSSPNGRVVTFDHPEIIQLAAQHVLHIGIVGMEVLLWGIMHEELGKSRIVAVLLPDIEKIVNVTDVLSCYIHTVAYDKDGDFLAATAFLQTVFLLVNDEVLLLDDSAEFGHKLSAVLKYIAISGEGDVICVT